MLRVKLAMIVFLFACAHRIDSKTALGLARETWVSYDTAFTNWYISETESDPPDEYIVKLANLKDRWDGIAVAITVAFAAAEVALSNGDTPNDDIQRAFADAVKTLRENGVPFSEAN